MGGHYHSLEDLPPTLDIFPLTGILLLPRGQLPLNVFEPRYLALVDDVLSGTACRHNPTHPARGQGLEASAFGHRLRRAVDVLPRERRRTLSDHPDRHMPVSRGGRIVHVPRFVRSRPTLRRSSTICLPPAKGFSAGPVARRAEGLSYPARYEGRLEKRDGRAAGDSGQRAGHALPLRTGRKTGLAGSARLGRTRRHPGDPAGNGERRPLRPDFAELRRRCSPIPNCSKSWFVPSPKLR